MLALQILGALVYASPPVVIQSTTQILPRFEKRFKELKSKDLVVFDLDNTLFRETQMLGTDEWYSHILHEMQTTKGVSAKAASNELEPLNKAIKAASSMRLMEESLPDLIRDLQRRNVYVLGLTARHPNLSIVTVQKLEELGINFSVHSLPEENLSGFSLKKLNHEFLFYNGIAFTDGAPKGLVLKELLMHSKIRPTKVIALDDRIHHVHTLTEALLEMKIQGHVIHYLKSLEQEFNPEIANYQFEQFKEKGIIISDQKAKEALGVCDNLLQSS